MLMVGIENMFMTVNVNSSKLSAISGQNPTQVKINNSSNTKQLVMHELCKLYPEHVQLIREAFTTYSVTNVSKNKCDVYIL